GNNFSFSPAVSADGRFVAFDSAASNLVPGDTNGTFDVFVRDRGAFFVSFADFSAKVEIEQPNETAVKATFRLGLSSNGIDPTRENVSFRVGAFAVTIAAGAFVADDKGRFRFEGLVDGVHIEAQIRPLKGGRFEFKAE